MLIVVLNIIVFDITFVIAFVAAALQCHFRLVYMVEGKSRNSVKIQ